MSDRSEIGGEMRRGFLAMVEPVRFGGPDRWRSGGVHKPKTVK
jgi:hypothetical protein